MAEPFPAESPYTLRDILDLLKYRAKLPAFEIRRREVMKPVYRDMPGNSATNQAHTANAWAALNTPQPGRLNLETATTLPIYRKFSKRCHKDYGSELNAERFSLILAEVIEGTGKGSQDALRMELGEFEAFWEEMEKPVPTAMPMPEMNFGQFFDLLGIIENNENSKPQLSPEPSNTEYHGALQYAVTVAEQRQSIQQTPGYESFRTFLLLEFQSPISAGIRAKATSAYLRRIPGSNAAEVDALSLEEYVVRMNKAGEPTARIVPPALADPNSVLTAPTPNFQNNGVETPNPDAAAIVWTEGEKLGKRIAFEPGTRSVILDGKKIATELDSEVSIVFEELILAYPEWITFKQIRRKRKNDGLQDNYSRILEKTPRTLVKLIESKRGKGTRITLLKMSNTVQ